MVVQHNLTAMNSNRMLGITTKTQAKSTERLSSGYKVNRAADDAAGLSISEKMRKQIRGLTQASLNAQDGISAVQTAEGALTEVHDMLQRMNELAVKSANGTNSQDDRQYIQDEIDQLLEEIDRVAETTKFNETYLLKGDASKSKDVTITVPGTPAKDLEAAYAEGKGGDGAIQLAAGKSAKDLFGAAVYAKGSKTAATADEILKNIELDDAGNFVLKDGVEYFDKAAVTTAFGAQTTAQTLVTTALIKVTTKVSTANDGTALVEAKDLADLFNTDGTLKAPIYAYDASITKNNWKQIGAEQVKDFINVTPGQEEVAETTKTETVTGALTLSLHVGADSDKANKISLDIESMSAKGIGVNGLKVDTEDSATAAIDTIKAAIQKVSTQRSALGAIQNRLEHTINNLDNVVENTTSAESKIRDTDMATEMVKYSNNNILAQAGQAMLAQANQANQGVLSLLG